jgi:hypothetical protein
MAVFRANNTIASPWEVFYFRGLYKRDAIPGSESKPEIKDFSFAEDVLYGRVDTRLNTVYPDEESMTVMFSENNTESSFRLLDFVSDAFMSVKSAMDAARDNGTIPNNQPFFSKFEIKRAYQSPIDLYNTYIDNLMNRFISEYLSVNNNSRHVLKFKQFVNHFMKFLRNQPKQTPFTFTSWQRSTTSNVFTSGIAVDIAGINFGDDSVIERTILNNPCLPYYFKVCRANGFLVSQLAPTIMVADILSPVLLPFAQNNNIFSTEDVFLTRYNYAYAADYDTMQAKLIDGYNLFVGQSPFEKIVTSKCPKTSSVTIKERMPVNIAQAQQQVSMNNWLSVYAQIRNIEEQGALDKQMMGMLLKQIKTTKYIDNFQAMRYINDTFRNTYKSKYGGLNYFINKRKEKNKDTEPSIEVSSGTSSTSGGSSGGY